MTRSSIFAALIVHLWQTTLFAGLVWLALRTVLRRLPPRVRFALWLSASLKFVIPFSALAAAGAALGSRFGRPGGESETAGALVQFVAESASAIRLAEPAAAVAAAEQVAPLSLLLGVWIAGSAVVLGRRWAEWLRIARMVRGARRMTSRDGVEVLESAALFGAGYEPGVFGAFKPVVLVPAGMAEHLTSPQLDAVLAHECCHVHRFDNLTAALHTLVEAAFWFHPMVWWLGHQLRNERERACDDAVLQRGVDPVAYAEGILSVCRLYVEPRLAAVAGVTGADLRRRIERIMSAAVEPPLTALHRLMLGAAAVLLVIVPIAHGALVDEPQDGGPDIRLDASEAFEIASVKPNRSGAGQRGIGFQQGGRFRASNMTVRGIVAAAFGSPQPLPLFRVVGGTDWIDSERYDVEAAADDEAAGTLTPPWPPRGQSMLRALLIERFKLVAHQEMRELPAYALTVAKPSASPGPQLRVSTGADCAAPAPVNANAPSAAATQIVCGGFAVTPPERLSGRYLTMDQLARFLSLNVVERPVVNRTGLAGHYSWDLDYNRGLTAAAGGAGEPPAGLSVFTALTEQLGLRLDPIRTPLDVVVIDSISRPTAN